MAAELFLAPSGAAQEADAVSTTHGLLPCAAGPAPGGEFAGSRLPASPESLPLPDGKNRAVQKGRVCPEPLMRLLLIAATAPGRLAAARRAAGPVLAALQPSAGSSEGRPSGSPAPRGGRGNAGVCAQGRAGGPWEKGELGLCSWLSRAAGASLQALDTARAGNPDRWTVWARGGGVERELWSGSCGAGAVERDA